MVKKVYYPFKDYSIRSENTRKRAITKDDIDKVIEYDLIDHPELNQARDYFIFSHKF